MKTHVFDTAELLAHEVATRIADLIRSNPRAVLGLATGSTPKGVYAQLVRMHREDGLSFAGVTSFNLDEYYPLKPDHAQSYHRYMNEHLFDHIDIDKANAHLPDGTIARQQVAAHCADYEQAIASAGGIDLQLLGIGRTGHIGFNEPPSEPDSVTRLVELDEVTRQDAIKDFGRIDDVPTHAITMGVGTILGAKQIILMACGEHKAEIVSRTLHGPRSSDLPASLLCDHPAVECFLDQAASGG